MTKTKKPHLFGYNVQILHNCIHSDHAPAKYGDWYEVYNNRLDPYISESGKCPSVNSIYDLKNDDTAFVVWVEWTSGDSFGEGTGISTEVIGLFTSIEDARFLKHALEEHNKKYDRCGGEQHSVKYHIVTPDSQVFESEWAPWLGYFEVLDAVHIDSVVMKKS